MELGLVVSSRRRPVGYVRVEEMYIIMLGSCKYSGGGLECEQNMVVQRYALERPWADQFRNSSVRYYVTQLLAPVVGRDFIHPWNFDFPGLPVYNYSPKESTECLQEPLY